MLEFCGSRDKIQRTATFILVSNVGRDDYGGVLPIFTASYKNLLAKYCFQDLKSDPKDEFLSSLRAIIRCIACPERYFEKAIRLATNRIGTDEAVLTRITTTRAEVDMGLIKELYYKRNSVPLDRAVQKDTRGDYKDFLLALIGHEDA